MYFNVHGLPVATDILHILTCTYRLNQCCTVTVAKKKEKILMSNVLLTWRAESGEGQAQLSPELDSSRDRFITAHIASS